MTAIESSEVDAALTVRSQEGMVVHQLVELYDAYVRFLTGQTGSPGSTMMGLNVTQWRALTLIRFNPNQTQRKLAQSVGIDPSSMTPIIDFFENRGWVQREKSTENRSAYRIRLTPAGAKTYKLIQTEIERTEDRFRSVLGEPQRQLLASLLHRLRDELQRSAQQPNIAERARRKRRAAA